MSEDPYVYPGTTVLRNHRGIRTQTELTAVEAEVTAYALAQLASRRIPGGYDLRHLQAFHRAIFGDLYRWRASCAPSRSPKPACSACPSTSPPTPTTCSPDSPPSSICGGWTARRSSIGSPTSPGRSTRCTRSGTGTAGPSGPSSASSLVMLTITSPGHG